MHNAVQRITAPDGSVMIVIPEDQYLGMVDALGELYEDTPEDDLADIRAADETMARIRAGEPTWPLDVVERLCDGEHPVRVFREWRGMKQRELAEVTGLSNSYLSEIENGARTGTIKTLKALAKALDVHLEQLTGGD